MLYFDYRYSLNFIIFIKSNIDVSSAYYNIVYLYKIYVCSFSVLRIILHITLKKYLQKASEEWFTFPGAN